MHQVRRDATRLVVERGQIDRVPEDAGQLGFAFNFLTGRAASRFGVLGQRSVKWMGYFLLFGKMVPVLPNGSILPQRPLIEFVFIFMFENVPI